jgi:uncharacterized protein (DUF486 family)
MRAIPIPVVTIGLLVASNVFMAGAATCSLGEPLRWNYLVGFGLILPGAWFVFQEF